MPGSKLRAAFNSVLEISSLCRGKLVHPGESYDILGRLTRIPPGPPLTRSHRVIQTHGSDAAAWRPGRGHRNGDGRGRGGGLGP